MNTRLQKSAPLGLQSLVVPALAGWDALRSRLKPGLQARSFSALLLLLLGTISASAAEVKLTGIACLHSGKAALVEIAPARPGPPTRFILRVGDRVAGIHLKSIDEKAGGVTILDGERTQELSLNGPEGVTNQTFNLLGADSEQVLELYQAATGLTVVRSPGLVQSKIDLKTGAGLTPIEAEAALAGVFREKGTVLAMRFEKYAFAVPFSYVPRLDSLQAPPAAPKSGDQEEEFPPGIIKFMSADPSQVLAIYQELAGRTLIPSPDLPRNKITVSSQTKLYKTEALWLLETLFRLGGITLIPEGKFIFVQRTTRENTLPAISSNRALARPRDEPFPAAFLKLNEAHGPEVLKIYAELIGRTAVSTGVPACRFTLRSQTPLTAAEAIYALDAAAALNHVRFATTDKEVRLVPGPTLLKDAAP